MKPLFIDRPEDLPDALARIDEPTVGVDVERADAPRYFRTAALIQVGTAETALLVDSVAMNPVPHLGDFLRERTTILHAAHNDLEPLRAVGVEVGSMHDTAIAASMLGLPIGLDPLLQELLGVSLSPDKERFQRADWEMRPLPKDMAEYAAGDVLHLAGLTEELLARLEDAGRRDWYEEELAMSILGAFDDNRHWTKVKGSGKLSPTQRAIVHAIWEEREAIGREFDIAPNRVLREEALSDLATNPAEDVADLIRRNKRRGRPSSVHAERLLAAQQRGQGALPEPKNSGSGAWTRADRDLYDALRKARSARATELGIEPGVLCPSRSLWGPVRGRATSAPDVAALAELRDWQAEQLAEVLWAVIEEAEEPQEAQDAAATVADSA